MSDERRTNPPPFITAHKPMCNALVGPSGNAGRCTCGAADASTATVASWSPGMPAQATPSVPPVSLRLRFADGAMLANFLSELEKWVDFEPVEGQHYVGEVFEVERFDCLDMGQEKAEPAVRRRWEPSGTAESVHAAAVAYAKCPGGTGSRYRERLLEAALAWAEEPFVQPTEQGSVDRHLHAVVIADALDGRGWHDAAEMVRGMFAAPFTQPTANVSPVDRWDARAGTWLDRSALEMPARSGSAIAARYSLAAELRQAWEAGFNEGGDEMREENRKLRSERRMADATAASAMHDAEVFATAIQAAAAACDAEAERWGRDCSEAYAACEDCACRIRALATPHPTTNKEDSDG